ncbi:hypothetical protein HDU88_008413 [Geranomyces variabilis]|nr:hypothetical protein HDU88_008413 [Geranomyces variabilis]
MSIDVQEVRSVPQIFKYKRNTKNGVILNFQPASQIADDKRFWLVNETLHKYKVVGYAAGAPVATASATHRLSQSGTDAVWRRESVTIGGRIVEDLTNYNLFTTHENALTSWETKQHLGQCEYYSTDENDRSAIHAKNDAYSVTEMTAEVDLASVFPVNSGIDSFKVVENELICQFAEPVKEYYEKILALMEGGQYLTIPMQLTSVSSTQRYPEGKAISNGSPVDGKVTTVDPEMYALSMKTRDFSDVKFSPTIDDLEGWEHNGKAVQHWSWRQNFKQSPDMIDGGLSTLADGRVMINISQYPNPPALTPDFTNTDNPIATFKDKTFHVFWTTDRSRNENFV